MAVDQVEAARRGQRRSKQAQYHPVDTRAKVSIAGSLGDAVRALSDDVQAKVLRSAAYAGAELLARELEARVPVDDGVLKSAVYTYYDRKSSVDGKHFYIVGINKAKAPHWFNVEYGHWRVNVVFRGPNGDLVVTKRRLPQPAWTPAHPYLRPTADRLPAAVEAMRTRLAERLKEVSA